jgi:protein-tyrosine phosphatase
MRVHRGAELRLDVPDPDLSDERLRLAGGRFVLVEFPYFIVPPRSARVLGWLLDQGWQPVLAHPERYSGVDGDLAAVAEWREAGAYLQVNGGSLLGRYGVAARRLAVGMLARGWVDYVCSDYHARGGPRVTSYGAWLERHGGPETAMRLLSDNPARLLSGELPLPVAPLAPDAGVEADEP